MHPGIHQIVQIMTEDLHLTKEQTQKFFEYLETAAYLVHCTGGELRSRQVIALALVTFCKQEGGI